MNASLLVGALLHALAAAVVGRRARAGAVLAGGAALALVAAMLAAEPRAGLEAAALAGGAASLGLALALRRSATRAAQAGAKAAALEEEQRRYVREASSHLEASRARFRALAEAAPLGVLEADEDGRCTYVSRRWTELTGLERAAARGEGWLAAAHPEERAALAEGWGAAVAARQAFQVELRAADGERWLYLQLVPRVDDEARGWVGTLTDVTERRLAERERRRLEERAQDARRLESLGLLAGGVAHDVTNLAFSILGNVHVLKELAAGQPELERSLARVETAATRASELARDLLGYAGRGRAGRELVDLSAVARETAELLEAGRPEGVALECELAAELPAVEGDPTQLRQLALNLLGNALEACAARGGRVRVRTLALESGGLGPHDTGTGEPLPAGAYVALEVSDDGEGMDEDTRRRMFDPFFSTKLRGRGLGLAVVQGAVRKLRGALQVETAPGAGTTIRALLPASDAPPLETGARREASAE